MKTVKDNELVELTTAQLAKEKGFYYSGGMGVVIDRSTFKRTEIPTQFYLQRWLREIHNIRVFVVHNVSGFFGFEIRTFDEPNLIGKWKRIGHIGHYDTYEKALEGGLVEALKIIVI